MLSQPSVSAIDLSDEVVPITIEETIHFSAEDRDWNIFEYISDTGYNGSATVGKNFWIGGFPLVEGIAGDADFRKVPSLMHGTVSVQLLSYNGSAPVNVVVWGVEKTGMLVPENGILSSTTSKNTIFSKLMSTGMTLSSSFEFRTVQTAVQLDNGSWIFVESYNYILKLNSNLVNYGMFQVALISNDNWTYAADVQIRIETVHNPVFFEMMEDRYLSFFPNSNFTSSILSPSISSSGHSTSSQIPSETTKVSEIETTSTKESVFPMLSIIAILPIALKRTKWR